LVKFYGLQPFYQAERKEDLLGHLIVGLAPHTSAGITGRIIGFTKANVCFAHPFWHAAKRRNCDGDEDAIMLFLDTLLNFSKFYLPEKRGGKMDAPLVITTVMDPSEVDDEAHKMEIIDSFPIEFYEKTWEGENPSCLAISTAQSILDNDPFSGFKFTHDCSDVTGPVLESRYVTLKTMAEKVEAQLKVAEKIRAIDVREVAELVINSHFLRDTIGNLRAFTRQKVRCVKCNAKYRRVPLQGKCTKCGGKLLLTVSEGNIRKYLGFSRELAENYDLNDYLKQRLELLSRQVDSLFTNDLSKQSSLAEYM
ncbi:DNA polymerase II large subunit, partial [Candidatus Altiarchaeota archaeon]